MSEQLLMDMNNSYCNHYFNCSKNFYSWKFKISVLIILWYILADYNLMQSYKSFQPFRISYLLYVNIVLPGIFTLDQYFFAFLQQLDMASKNNMDTNSATCI